MMTMTQFVLIIGIAFLNIFVYAENHLLFGQVSQLPSIQIPSETIRILNPITGQNVSAGDGLMISGQSSDNNFKNCSVSVIINDVKPYQNAVAKGEGGKNDFSKWEFELHRNYSQIIEGENKITSKLLCLSEPTRWYSVLVNGVNGSSKQNTGDVFSSVLPDREQNTSAASNDAGALQPKEQLQPPQDNISAASNGVGNGTKEMIVSISVEKNPIARGERQSATILVTDSDSNAIANAQINGKLIYPGNNYEKEFTGLTNLEGNFIYSWIIGKKGDVGPLSIEVQASHQNYSPSSATDSFEIAES